MLETNRDEISPTAIQGSGLKDSKSWLISFDGGVGNVRDIRDVSLNVAKIETGIRLRDMGDYRVSGFRAVPLAD